MLNLPQFLCQYRSSSKTQSESTEVQEKNEEERKVLVKCTCIVCYGVLYYVFFNSVKDQAKKAQMKKVCPRKRRKKLRKTKESLKKQKKKVLM